MEMTIALAGNPNSGKTTIFNELTGSSQYVGNWPGVTVEKKEGRLRKDKAILIEDLPGIYSLSPYTLEEVVSRNYLLDEQPNVILNIVDATNIERNLYLTTQLLELGIPTVIALNMMDVLEKTGDRIDIAQLSRALGVEIVPTAATKAEGLDTAVAAALRAAEKGEKRATAQKIFSASVEGALSQIAELINGAVPADRRRWAAIKLFERDEKAVAKFPLSTDKGEAIDAIIRAVETAEDDDSESIITNQRYEYIQSLTGRFVHKKQTGLTMSDKIDRIVTNRWLGLPIFAAVMTLVYYLSITTVGTAMTDWVNDVLFTEIIPPAVEGWLASIHTAEWLTSLVLDGIIAGIGAVLGFLPQMMVLFLCLAFLEDCGYMARIAFVMDRIFRKFGLSGKSFIPILIGTGCSVPGIMASRTIENDHDRKLTIITTSFMPCSAKLPIIALIAGALFGGVWWVGPSAYFVGIAAIILSGILLKKTSLFAGDPSPFVMELPAYHWPSLKGVWIHTWDRAKAFVKKAGTVIFLACAAIWFLSSYNWSIQAVDASESMLSSIGSALVPLFKPLGWGHWQAVVAAITGLVAKENVVGTFGILYGFAEATEESTEVWAALQQSFTQLAAYSFLIFNLLCAPCFAAIGAIRREMGSAKWTWVAIGYQTVLAYGVALTFYQLGLFFNTGAVTVWTVIALLLAAEFLYLLLRPMPESKKNQSARYKTAPEWK